MNTAMRRITNIREPTIVGKDAMLRNNQSTVREIKHFDYWFNTLRCRAKTLFLSTPESEVWRWIWATLPHPKREMRIDCLNGLYFTGKYSRRNWLRRVRYKVKQRERAKMRKNARGIGDLGVAASAQAAYIAGDFKELFTEQIVVGNFRLRFCASPRKSALRELFADMHNSEYTEFVFFSDDSCIAHTENGIRKWANVDIKSCDASHYENIFGVLEDLMSIDDRYSTDVHNAFAQLDKDVEIFNPENLTQRVKLKTKIRTLFSGSAFTTLLNNVANSLIALGTCELLEGGYTLKDALEKGAERVGYMVTCDFCDCFEKVTFLQHFGTLCPDSPTGIEVNLDPGVILRSWGECDLRIPGPERISIDERARRFNSEVMRSHRHSGQNPVTEAFRKKFVLRPSYNYHIVSKSLDEAPGRIGYESLARRYDIQVALLMDFVENFLNICDIGDWVAHPAVVAILQTDYGAVYPQ